MITTENISINDDGKIVLTINGKTLYRGMLGLNEDENLGITVDEYIEHFRLGDNNDIELLDYASHMIIDWDRYCGVHCEIGNTHKLEEPLYYLNFDEHVMWYYNKDKLVEDLRNIVHPKLINDDGIYSYKQVDLPNFYYNFGLGKKCSPIRAKLNPYFYTHNDGRPKYLFTRRYMTENEINDYYTILKEDLLKCNNDDDLIKLLAYKCEPINLTKYEE